MKAKPLNSQTWIVFSFALVTAVLIIAILFSPIFSAKQILQITKVRKLKPGELKTLPGINYAQAKFWERGGTYQWGPNDCSVFVTDFLKASGSKITKRLTTAELANSKEMAKLGYVKNFSNLKAGDILVFRYRNQKGQLRGHCGVTVQLGNEQYVVHNTAGHGGLVIQELANFQQHIDTLNPVLNLIYTKSSKL